MEKLDVPIRISGMHQGSRVKVLYIKKDTGNLPIKIHGDSVLIYSGSVNITGTVEFMKSTGKGASIIIIATHPGFFDTDHLVPISLDFGVDFSVTQLVDVWAVREVYKRLRKRTEAWVFSGVIAILVAYVLTHI